LVTACNVMLPKMLGSLGLTIGMGMTDRNLFNLILS